MVEMLLPLISSSLKFCLGERRSSVYAVVVRVLHACTPAVNTREYSATYSGGMCATCMHSGCEHSCATCTPAVNTRACTLAVNTRACTPAVNTQACTLAVNTWCYMHSGCEHSCATCTPAVNTRAVNSRMCGE